MTKKEQIDGIAKYVCNACEFGIYRACSERQSDVKSCSLALGTARRIYNAGYRKVPDGAVVLTPEERDDEMKATNEILAERDDLIAKVGILGRENYDLKAEIKRLEKENRQLKTECALLDDELRIARQETINVLNELKTKLCEFADENEDNDGKIDKGIFLIDVIGVTTKDGEIISLGLIDELLKEYENDERRD